MANAKKVLPYTSVVQYQNMWDRDALQVIEREEQLHSAENYKAYMVWYEPRIRIIVTHTSLKNQNNTDGESEAYPMDTDRCIALAVCSYQIHKILICH